MTDKAKPKKKKKKKKERPALGWVAAVDTPGRRRERMRRFREWCRMRGVTLRSYENDPDARFI